MKHKLSKTVADHEIECRLFRSTGIVLAMHDARDSQIMGLLSASFLSKSSRRTLQAYWAEVAKRETAEVQS